MITMTPEAVDQLKEYLQDEGTPEAMLRVFVAPGGCSGLQYGMSVEETSEEDDHVIEQDGIKLLVDQFSAMYLGGAEIDYVNSLMGGGFTVRNPNAVASPAPAATPSTRATTPGPRRAAAAATRSTPVGLPVAPLRR